MTDKRRREGKADQYEAYLTESGETLIRKIQEAQTMGWTQEAGQSRDWYLEAALNFQRDFGLHHVSALAMYNQTMKYYPSKNTGIPRSYVGFVGRATLVLVIMVRRTLQKGSVSVHSLPVQSVGLSLKRSLWSH